MSETLNLTDSFGRRINYLRLSVTDRCNLRCFYCMPAHGIAYKHRSEILSYEEMLRLVTILRSMGVNKVRITGGEPFVRKDLLPFLQSMNEVPGIEQVSMTTNGVLAGNYLSDLKQLGILDVNLSMDTLDPQRFFNITRRDEFHNVWRTLQELLSTGFRVKVNMVVMGGINEQDIVPMAQLAEKWPVAVRFIEEMPFNGSFKKAPKLIWDHRRILKELATRYPNLTPAKTTPSATANRYLLDGAPGELGIIPAYTRTFCGTCNRLRISADGQLRTCLYSATGLDLKQLMRQGADDDVLRSALKHSIAHKPKDGLAAERQHRQQPLGASMSTIGG
jgi:cyclic pyranopterin phosphate synthase